MDWLVVGQDEVERRVLIDLASELMQEIVDGVLFIEKSSVIVLGLLTDVEVLQSMQGAVNALDDQMRSNRQLIGTREKTGDFDDGFLDLAAHCSSSNLPMIGADRRDAGGETCR